ncbi:MAG TPA: peptidoglycan-binding protein [Acidimicrobiales bacterium]|nr:peptidoglycan-binding protein [Acidimicrobiales bacterium]
MLPLHQGDRGEAVTDVQRRLAALRFFAPESDVPGGFGPATRAAVEAFQHRRGLRVDGVVGRQTWETLVEAGFGRLGDRFLYRRRPMLRGDDVAELQQRLGSLGFDTGRVDGIFGDQTSAALAEFQRNAGLPADGILGATTLRELLRVEARHPELEVVSTVRDREHLRRSPPTLVGRHLAVGESGGLAATLAALRRRLVFAGARVTSLHHPDGSAQAAQANAAGADVYLGLSLNPDSTGVSTSYYRGWRYESAGGRGLAEAVQRHVPPTLDLADLSAQGMSLPVLRETTMPAVIVEVGPATVVVERGSALARALVDSLIEWAGASWD